MRVDPLEHAASARCLSNSSISRFPGAFTYQTVLICILNACLGSRTHRIGRRGECTISRAIPRNEAEAFDEPQPYRKLVVAQVAFGAQDTLPVEKAPFHPL